MYAVNLPEDRDCMIYMRESLLEKLPMPIKININLNGTFDAFINEKLRQLRNDNKPVSIANIKNWITAAKSEQYLELAQSDFHIYQHDNINILNSNFLTFSQHMNESIVNLQKMLELKKT